MATTSNSTPDLFDFEGALKQWTDATRKATEDALDLYVKTVDEVATVSREVAGAYAGSVRDLINA
jgi:hypothetical protein